MKFSAIFLFLCLLATLFYIIGLLFFLTDHEPGNNCEMTYMFEYPQYVRITQNIDEKYPKYGLYAYGEGRMTKKTRNMQFDGIPVLFIPGNAGSYKQVRSLASIALRKYLNSATYYHFDYFTVDLNEEFSAIYGPLLYEQLEYVTYSIIKILELYKDMRDRPQKVILIGHSVGGTVARRTIGNLELNNKDLVSLLITLASPLKRSPIYFDRYGSKFYKYLHTKQETYNSIDIAGGFSDFLIPSYLTNIEGNNSINVVGSNIPKSWVESGHVQILWCKQTILAINRALFDSVDRETFQISSNTSFVQSVFRHHLIHNSGTKIHLGPNYPTISKIDYKGEWFETIYKQFTVDHKKGVKQPHWYMVALSSLLSHEALTVLVINLEVTNWIFACNAGYPKGSSRVCIEGEHLTQFSEITPSSRFKRRLISLNLNEIKRNHPDYTHVVFRALPTSKPVTFHVDVYALADRRREVALPKLPLEKQVILTSTPEKSVFFELVFPGLTNVLQAYQLFVEPFNCAAEQHHATATLIVPWANENRQAHFTESLRKPFSLRLQNAKPANASDARVQLTLEPSCVYRISIRLNIFGIFSHIARYYSTFLITNVAVVFLLVFQNQIYMLGKTGSVPIFFSSLFHIVKYSWIIIIAAGILSVFLSYPLWTKFLPQPELTSFPNNGSFIDLIVMPLVLHMISVITVLVLVSMYCISLFALESTVHKLTLKLLARSVTLTIRFSDYLVTFLHKVPFTVAAVLILLCFSTCGGLALCVGMVFYFLKLTQMSQDVVEHITWFVIKSIARKLKHTFTRRHQTQTEVTDNQNNESIEQITQNTDQSPEQENNDNSLEASILKFNEETVTEDNKTEIVESVNNIVEEVNDTELITEYNDENLEEKSEELDAPNRNNEPDSFFKGLADTNPFFFHSSMFMIWCMVTGLNLPAVLIWAHNFKYNKRLPHDESFLPGLLLSISAFPLWQFSFPSSNRKCIHELRLIILYFTVVILIYGTISVYVVNYLLTILFILVVMQQYYNLIIAQNQQSWTDEDESKEQDRYDEIKMKMD